MARRSSVQKLKVAVLEPKHDDSSHRFFRLHFHFAFDCNCVLHDCLGFSCEQP
jgi:hypothetical protein